MWWVGVGIPFLASMIIFCFVVATRGHRFVIQKNHNFLFYPEKDFSLQCHVNMPWYESELDYIFCTNVGNSVLQVFIWSFRRLVIKIKKYIFFPNYINIMIYFTMTLYHSLSQYSMHFAVWVLNALPRLITIAEWEKRVAWSKSDPVAKKNPNKWKTGWTNHFGLFMCFNIEMRQLLLDFGK